MQLRSTNQRNPEAQHPDPDQKVNHARCEPFFDRSGAAIFERGTVAEVTAGELRGRFPAPGLVRRLYRAVCGLDEERKAPPGEPQRDSAGRNRNPAPEYLGNPNTIWPILCTHHNTVLSACLQRDCLVRGLLISRAPEMVDLSRSHGHPSHSGPGVFTRKPGVPIPWPRLPLLFQVFRKKM
jgi:hypothetical protein